MGEIEGLKIALSNYEHVIMGLASVIYALQLGCEPCAKTVVENFRKRISRADFEAMRGEAVAYETLHGKESTLVTKDVVDMLAVGWIDVVD